MKKCYEEIAQRTLDSSSRSVVLLHEAEQTGVATANELAHQRVQLELTDNRLDTIEANQIESDKHLNGIQSVFHSVKNFVCGKPRSRKSFETHSVLDGPSRSGMAGTVNNNSKIQCSNTLSTTDVKDSILATPVTVPNSQHVEKMLNANLDEMNQQLNRIKILGTEMVRELDAQNELIDSIHHKVVDANLNIEKQNKMIQKKILNENLRR
ncbi:hypothetical protein O0L34_g13359 [Tuta absoluta]|nr:hypothetical protein O0L34_g13359 [Tuta absoluta]